MHLFGWHSSECTFCGHNGGHGPAVGFLDCFLVVIVLVVWFCAGQLVDEALGHDERSADHAGRLVVDVGFEIEFEGGVGRVGLRGLRLVVGRGLS